jgi:hypothetical protein
VSRLDPQELDVLKTILRFHGVESDKAVEHLETFSEWIRDTERAKFNRNINPQLPLVLLSLMGIRGSDALDPARMKQ